MDIKDFLKQWENVLRVIEIYPSNKVNAGCSVNLCEENAVRHFRSVLKMCQKQVSLEHPCSDLQLGTSVEKRLKKDTANENVRQTGKP